jgi:hypothetical protein
VIVCLKKNALISRVAFFEIILIENLCAWPKLFFSLFLFFVEFIINGAFEHTHTYLKKNERGKVVI